MRLKAVRKYRNPRYPTVDYLMEHPELLRYIPKRWRRKRLVLGILSMIIPIIIARHAATVEAKDLKTKDVRVAPIFVHGDGRGSFGCIVVNPPVFLSEGEARQIVQDEAKKSGITLSYSYDDKVKIKRAALPVTDRYASRSSKSHKDVKTRDLVLDGYDEKWGIGYEFVSKWDFEEWETRDKREMSTAYSYDYKKTAERLINNLSEAKGKSIIGVFYDPGASAPRTNPPTRNNKTPEEFAKEYRNYRNIQRKVAEEIAEKQLREQVRNFLEWLKAEGVI